MSIGCHVVLVDGEPILPPDQVRSLLAPGTNRFYYSIGEIVKALVKRQFRAEEIEAEASAQFERLRRAGVSISHFDAHKHTHMFPAILRPVLRAAKAHGIKAVRNAFEAYGTMPQNKTMAIRSAQTFALRAMFRKRWVKLVREFGLETPDGCIGVSATGALDQATLLPMLERLPEGTWELVCHPGYNDRDLAAIRTRLRSSREVEFALLTSLDKPQMNERYGVDLISYDDLVRRKAEQAI